MSTTTALTSEQRAALRDVVRRHPGFRILTVRQPHADLIIAGVKDIHNLPYPPPSTLPEWWSCANQRCKHRWVPEGEPGWCPSCQWGLGNFGPDGHFPFPLGIHAAKKVDRRGLDALLRRYGSTSTIEEPGAGITRSWLRWADAKWAGRAHPYDDRLGVLLGFVTVLDAHPADDCRYAHTDAAGIDLCSRWAQPDLCHWTIANPEPLDTPVPMVGHPRLWKPPEHLTAPATAGM